ncbi:MAG: hypothetical protein V1746_06970 [bacterium]
MMRGRGVFYLLVGGTLLFFTACAVNGPVSASGISLKPEELSQAEQRVVQEQIPEPLKPYYVALYSEGKQNFVLHAMRGGLAALKLGYFDLAKKTFDQAIREVEALQEGAAQAERAKSKFVGEKEKWFKGESYERAALYFYRGMLYLRDEDYGNAAACFRRSQLQDITSEDEKGFAGDWTSDELGLALASYYNGYPEDAENALKRAEKFPSKQGEVPAPTPTTNVLVLMSVGNGPEKYRAGKYREQLKFKENAPAIRELEVLVGDKKTTFPVAENLYVQATTRGARQIDCILGDKASFKEDTANAAVALGAGALVASQVDSTGIATGVLALAALGSAIFSSATNPEADIRAWSNLPHSIYLLNLTVPSDAPTIKITALDAQKNVLDAVTLDNVLSDNKKLHVFFVPGDANFNH